MAAAVRTILLADLVMSLDNVIAVAAAAKGNNLLLIVGLAVSIPLVVFANRLLLGLMERFPVIIVLGAALLGWVAGEMAIGDPVASPWIDANARWLHYGAPLAGAVAVVLIGKALAARKTAAQAAASVRAPAAAEAGAVLRRVLLASDGSPGAALALQRLLGLRGQLRDAAGLEVHLVNVQRRCRVTSPPSWPRARWTTTTASAPTRRCSRRARHWAQRGGPSSSTGMWAIRAR